MEVGQNGLFNSSSVWGSDLEILDGFAALD
jgi:hypothetical protein